MIKKKPIGLSSLMRDDRRSTRKENVAAVGECCLMVSVSDWTLWL